MFLDKEFPPNRSSLGHPVNPSQFIDKVHASIVWKRLSDIYPSTLEVFHNIDPNDIVQGNLGDCYLLSAISALAEFPDRVKKLFYTQDISSNGKYALGAYNDGVWTSYEIDDFFPCIGDSLAFSRPRNEDGVIEIWVILLEKLWAKRLGGYFNLEQGSTACALRDMTGAPCETISTSLPDFWEIINNANRNSYVVTANLKPTPHLVNSIGLNTLYSYTIVESQNYRSEKLLQIRNPWVRHEFYGDWSDTSNKWTEEAKKAMKWDEKPHNGLWMNSDDFVSFFDSVTICMARNNFKYTSLISQGKCFKVSQYSEGLTYFNITQQGEGPVRIVIANSRGYMKGKCGIGKDVWISLNSKMEDYYVYTERDDDLRHVTFSVYCEKNVKIEAIEEIAFWNVFWKADAFKKHLRCKKGELCPGVVLYNLEMIGPSERQFHEGFVYDVIENTLNDSCAMVEYDIVNLRNIQVIGNTSFVLEPQKHAFVSFKHVDLTEDYKLEVQARVRLVPA